MNADLEKLTKLMPPPADAPRRTVNWDAVEQSLGVVDPPDFKEFIGVYGGAVWCDRVNPNYCTGESAKEIDKHRRYLDEIVGYFEENTYNEEWEEVRYPPYYEEGGLLPFLESRGGAFYCWICDGDPKNWMILCWIRGGTRLLSGLNVTQMFLEWLERKPRTIEMWGEFFLSPEKFGLRC